MGVCHIWFQWRSCRYYISGDGMIDDCCKYKYVFMYLISQKLPSRPWQFIMSDLFEIDNQQYLLITDRYSKYPFVDKARL